MDAKNDDSAGSDSLDKSLQTKCVVDDVHDAVQQTAMDNVESCASAVKKQRIGDCDPVNSIEKTTTEGGVSGGEHERAQTGGVSVAEVTSLCANETTVVSAVSACTESAASCSTSSNSRSSPGKAFETKVKQISKNLKETTLADSASTVTPEGFGLSKKVLDDTSSSSPPSSSSSSSSSSEQELRSGGIDQELSENAAALLNADTQQTDAVDLDTSFCSTEANDDDDSINSRSKKVRFHPDVKENDGGNRIMPKKKKRIRQAYGDPPCQPVRLDFDVDMDEEDDEEEEFDLAKTIAEANDYLKSHPLTFAHSQNEGGAKLQNGLLEEEDLRNMSESSSDEEDIYEKFHSENGIERILGKLIKSEKVEYLVRYAHKSELSWENEDYINKQCPLLLTLYERNRERLQEKLMRYVAKRQNIRQRYTDF